MHGGAPGSRGDLEHAAARLFCRPSPARVEQHAIEDVHRAVVARSAAVVEALHAAQCVRRIPRVVATPSRRCRRDQNSGGGRRQEQHDATPHVTS
jgi:hypothetical protein